MKVKALKRYPRTVVRIVWDAEQRAWLAVVRGQVIDASASKDLLVFEQAANLDLMTCPPRTLTAQLVVHRKDGRFHHERTYPRSSDPRRHRG